MSLLHKRDGKNLLPLRTLFLAVAISISLTSTGWAAVLDKGTLDPSWFGGDVEFRKTEVVDYLWVKRDFSIDGRTFHFQEWPAPEFIGENAGKRGKKDRQLAQEMNRELPDLFAMNLEQAFGTRAGVSRTEGDVLVTGRIVDCERGNKAAKFLAPVGAGAGKTRIDLKFVDAESGELLVALHARVTSTTVLSNTWDKFVSWVRKFSHAVGEHGFDGLYAEGKPVTE